MGNYVTQFADSAACPRQAMPTMYYIIRYIDLSNGAVLLERRQSYPWAARALPGIPVRIECERVLEPFDSGYQPA